MGLLSGLFGGKQKSYSEAELKRFATQARLEAEPEELEALETKEIMARLGMEEGIGVKDKALVELNTPETDDYEDDDELDTGLIL
jgi:hypothetical protein